MRRLEILHLITHFAVGGATEMALTTCQHLDRNRFRAHVLSGATEPTQQTMDGFARDVGVDVEILPSLRHAVHPQQDWKAYQDLVAYLQRGRWDILHTHGSKAGFLGRMAAAKAGVPVIIHHVHGWGHHASMSRAARAVYVHAERHAARVTDQFLVAASANTEKGLGDGIGRREQYETVYNGIDVDRFSNVQVDRSALRRSLDIPEFVPVVGTVSRLAPQKAPHDFVKMAQAIHSRRPDVHFVYVGGGPMEEPFSAAIEEAQLGQHVHSLGYRNDIPELLRVFDVFVLTSLWEGLPRVFSQAMCANLPIVATEVDGAPEAIEHGVNGLLVPAGEPLRQAEQVLSLLEDPALRRRMGNAGRSRVETQFCELAMVRHIESVYLSHAVKKGLVRAEDLLTAHAADPVLL